MILSNLMLLFSPEKSFYYNLQNFIPENGSVFYNLNCNESETRLRSNPYSKLFIASSTDSINNNLIQLEKTNLVPRKFWQKLVNQFFQETIFLSNSNNSSSKYVNKLRTLGIAVYKGSDYRNFLNKFSKDLVNGKIKVEVNNSSDDNVSTFFYKQNHQQHLKYTWFKFINFGVPVTKSRIDNANYSNHAELINRSLPMFIVVNDKKEIVTSESTDQLHCSDILLKAQSFFIKNKNNSKRLYTSLIFINHEDALEYKNYIESYYSNSTRSINLQVIPTNMNIYYKFMSIYNQNFEFRLIPDLKEVSSLVYQYKKNSNLSFKALQKHGTHYFQGQPIYFIKPFSYKTKYNQSLKSFKYNKYFSLHDNYFNCNVVFLNYQTLINMWQKFIKDNNFHSLLAVPEIDVSNLENFIHHNDYKKNYDKITFLPSLKSYDFIKNYLTSNTEKQFTAYNRISSKLFYLKTLCWRILWSLTIRQPVNL
uniref:Uncharacterized protein n=1 Tax=Polysiphonia scopulorum TaxID=257860 RepID=A0A1Z1MHW7_9FLOR|nr:hypothetical protein [Polysiphonia scopulorum]ARW65556.1 hypothetical protein [Polysiphonia scopulorum]